MDGIVGQEPAAAASHGLGGGCGTSARGVLTAPQSESVVQRVCWQISAPASPAEATSGEELFVDVRSWSAGNCRCCRCKTLSLFLSALRFGEPGSELWKLPGGWAWCSSRAASESDFSTALLAMVSNV